MGEGGAQHPTGQGGVHKVLAQAAVELLDHHNMPKAPPSMGNPVGELTGRLRASRSPVTQADRSCRWWCWSGGATATPTGGAGDTTKSAHRHSTKKTKNNGQNPAGGKAGPHNLQRQRGGGAPPHPGGEGERGGNEVFIGCSPFARVCFARRRSQPEEFAQGR